MKKFPTEDRRLHYLLRFEMMAVTPKRRRTTAVSHTASRAIFLKISSSSILPVSNSPSRAEIPQLKVSVPTNTIATSGNHGRYIGKRQDSENDAGYSSYDYSGQTLIRDLPHSTSHFVMLTLYQCVSIEPRWQERQVDAKIVSTSGRLRQ